MPTLIVLDYVSGRVSQACEIAQALKSRRLENPVRLLLLDREGGLDAEFSGEDP